MRLSSDNDIHGETTKGTITTTHDSLSKIQGNKQLLEDGKSPTLSPTNTFYVSAGHSTAENTSHSASNLNERKVLNFFIYYFWRKY